MDGSSGEQTERNISYLIARNHSGMGKMNEKETEEMIRKSMEDRDLSCLINKNRIPAGFNNMRSNFID